MNQKQEKWAIFWCDLLAPVIYEEIEAEQTHQFLRERCSHKVVFPDGECKRPSLSTLKRKLKKYRGGGFKALFRKHRKDDGTVRIVTDEVIERAIELKKEQPLRSHISINGFLQDQCGKTLSRSTLYWHLKQAGATRMKLGIVKNKIRGRWTKDHTHDLWVGDFEEGPYVFEDGDNIPTYLSAFIDCHSRYVVEARYYVRQNLDVLIDSLIRALSKHGAPGVLYVDNAKVYHSHGLTMACHIMGTRLLHRPARDPAPGGLIERFFQTAQTQFEAEVRLNEILTLDQLNKAFAAWLNAGYHKQNHSEINTTPEKQMEKGLGGIRLVDMKAIISAFMEKILRTVNRTFCDVRVNNLFFKVDPGLRGDKVQVGLDPFSSLDMVEIYSLKGVYQGCGQRHYREPGQHVHIPEPVKPKHNYLSLLIKKHQQEIDRQVKGIDYRKAAQQNRWSFSEFASRTAGLLGSKGGLTSFNAGQLEALKKVYNQSILLNRQMLEQAFENATHKSIPYIIQELKQIIKQEIN